MKARFSLVLRAALQSSPLFLGILISGCGGDPQPEPKTMEQEVQQLQEHRQKEWSPPAPAAKP